MIRLNNITKVYEAKEGNVIALKDISINVKKGEIYGIMGVSGAGKSTLIRCLNLLEKPSSGEVWVNNVNLTNLSASRLREERKNIGMIFQHYNLLSSRTVFDNIAYPLELAGVKKEDRKNRIDELLNLVDLTEKKNHFPSQLSGGQRQRVAIARALATNPEVLLSDEATSALDPITSRSILNLLQEINEKLGVTIVLITHEMEVIERICHRVAVIKDGTIVEENTVSKVFTSPENPYTKLLLGIDDSNYYQKDSINLFKTKKVGGL